MQNLTPLERRLEVSFQNPMLLHQALVHRSYLNESTDFILSSNERLEFLGDALVGYVIAEYLYQQFPLLPEGLLSAARSVLVQQATLAELAKEWGLGDYLYLGKGTEASEGRRRPSILSGAVEAVFGAVLLDQGLDAAREMTLRWLGSQAFRALAVAREGDPRSRLQMVAQTRWRTTPRYRTVAIKGPDHAREFTVEVLVEQQPLGFGSGPSKRLAAMQAAAAALEGLSQQEGDAKS